MRAVLIFCLLFLSFAGAKAQTYVLEKEKTVCSNNASAIRLGEDVLGLGLSAGGGVWNEVDPLDNTTILEADISNVFMALNRMPGEYHFVFTSKNNPCLPDGDKALAKVIIVDNPVSSGHKLLLCASEAHTITLSDYLSPVLASTTGLTFAFSDPAGSPITGGSYVVPTDFEGNLNFSYTITGADYICNKSANLTIIVERGVDTSTLPTSNTLSVCQTAIPGKVDLNQILGVNMPGTWAVDPSTSGATAPAPAGNTVTLKGIIVSSLPATLTYKLTPSGSCYSSYTPTVSVVITDDLNTNFNDVTHDVCKTSSPNGYIDLMALLGVDVPVNSGVWNVVSQPSPVDVQNGVFDLKDARSGTYEYTFDIHNSVSLCGLASESAKVTLNIFDSGETLDGEVQVCAATTGSLPLSDYISGLPTTGVTWYSGLDATGTALTGGTVDLSTLGLGVHAYTYAYDAGSCGNSEGNLYVTVADELTNFTDKTIKYCLTDDGADAIDLDQILAVYGVNGTWSLDVTNSTSDQSATGNWNATTNVFDGRAAASAETTTPNAGTYVFKFTAGADACSVNSGDVVNVTIKITQDLTN